MRHALPRSATNGGHRLPTHAGGFTLLEVLVAVTVMGLILTAAFGALRLGSRSWEAGIARAAETEERRSVAGFLQRQFAQALPLTWPEDNKDTPLAFDGSARQVRFIAPSPQQQASAGLFEFALTAERPEAGAAARLVLSYAPFSPSATPVPGTGERATGRAGRRTEVCLIRLLRCPRPEAETRLAEAMGQRCPGAAGNDPPAVGDR